MGLCSGVRAAQPVHIEVAIQEGGEKPETFSKIIGAFEASHPGIVVDADIDPRIVDKVRVRILEKDFPEITNGDFGAWDVIRAGDVLPLDATLDGPAWSSKGPAKFASWRDSFLPGTLDRYSSGGHTYAVPLSYYAHTIWFNRLMFAAHGWQVPHTWDQLLALCATIKAAGIAPFAFQGRYPEYARMFVDGGYYQLAGGAALAAQKRLEAGSFDNAAMVQSLGWLQTIATQYFQSGAMGMSHTEAQLQFFLGHTAMLPCGSWLKSEMAGKIPDDFELGTFNLPAAPGGLGDPTALRTDSSMYAVFSHSKHPAEAVEFLRFLTSPEVAAYFCRENDMPVAVRGVNERNLSAGLGDLATLIHESRANYSDTTGDYFPTMGQSIDDVLLALMNGQISATAAAKQLESDAAAVRIRQADPGALPVVHRIKGIALLALLAVGTLYACGNALGRRQRGSAAKSGQGPRAMSMGSALLFVGPALLLFGGFVVVPAVRSFSWSLQQWDGISDAKFVGLLHFRYLLFQSDGFWIALANNIFLMVVIPLCMVPLALFLAACVSRGVHGAKIFRSAFLLPSVMGAVATSILWMNLYAPQAGIINPALAAAGRGLTDVGLSGAGAWFKSFDGFAWLSQDHLYTALVPMSVWAGFGFNFVLYLAAMETVPTELYEAAELDGASALQQFRIVTLPLIWEVLTISAVFLIIGGMKAFETVWLLTNQQPTTKVHVIGTQMIRAMFTDMHIGEAAAIAVLLTAMVFVASVVALRAMDREAIER